MLVVELVYFIGTCISHASVKVRFSFLFNSLEIFITNGAVGSRTLGRLSRLWYVPLCEFKCLLSSGHLPNNRLLNLLRQRVVLGLHPYLLRVLLRCLFFQLSSFPLLSSDVGTKTAKSRVLGLNLLRLVLSQIVGAELTRSARIVGLGVLLRLLVRALAFHLRIRYSRTVISNIVNLSG